MNLGQILQKIRFHDSLDINSDDSEKLDLYIASLERIIRILDKEGKNEYNRTIRKEL